MASLTGAAAILGFVVVGAGCGSTTPPASSGRAGASGAAGTAGSGAGGGVPGAAGSGAAGAGGAAGQKNAGSGGAAGGAAGGAGGLAGAAAGANGGTSGLVSAGPLFCNGTVLGIADFNDDGIPDCVVTTPLADQFEEAYPAFLLGLGYGAYSRTGIVSPIVLYNTPIGLSTVDLSGDGIPDLAVASDFAQIAAPNALVLVYMKALGDGTFTTGSQISFPGTTSVGWRLAGTGDFNGDGKPDVLVAAWNQTDTENAYWLLIGDKGSTQMSAGFTLGSQGTLSMGNVPGDFNGDHNLDVAAALHVVALGGSTTSQDVIISYGAGDGTFAAPVHVPGTTGATSVSVGDLNGDGKLDLDISYAGSDALVPLYGDGAGNFSATLP